MIELLSKSFLSAISRNILVVIITLSLIIIRILFVGIHSKQWRWLINRRVLIRLIIACVIFFLSSLFPENKFPLMIFCWISAGFIAITGLFLNRLRIFPENIILDFLRKKYETSDLTKFNDLSEKKLPFLFSVPSRIDYLYILARSLMDLRDFPGTLKIYNRIEKLPLFDDEKSKIIIMKAQLFALVGDIKCAENLLKKIDLLKYSKLKPTFLFVSSLTEEEKGNFLKANKLLDEILEYEEDDTIILNNIGRMKFFRGNKLEQLRYYERAFESEKTNYRLKHTICKNLIDSLLLNGRCKEATRKFKEYEQKFSKGTLFDQASFIEYKMEYGRQIKNRGYMLEAIADMLFQVMPNLSEKEQLHMLISVLRTVYNLPPIVPIIEVREYRVTLPGIHDNLTQLQTILFAVKQKWNGIQSLEFKEKFLLNKEIIDVLESISNSNLITPFKDMLNELEQFFKDSIKEIDKIVISTDKHFVYDIWEWENNQLYAKRFLQKNMKAEDWPDYIKRTLSILNDIKNELEDRGAILSSIEATLNLIDETLAFIDFINDSTIKNNLFTDVQKKIIAVNDRLWKMDNSQLIIFHIRLAYYSMKMNNYNICKMNYKAFLDSGISIDHCANWIKIYAIEVEKYLKTCKNK